MKYTLHFLKKISGGVKGFVLPFTLLIAGIMLLISVSISTILIKQIYFSNIGRESQAAYYAADNALACALSIDETYTEGSSGFFPSDPLLSKIASIQEMKDKLARINLVRESMIPALKPLAKTITEIKCGQSDLFDDTFNVEDVNFEWKDDGGATLEFGKTSSFTMKMDVKDGTYRCAKVTINKTSSYTQIISQGYSKCDRPDSSVERAIVYRTMQ